MLKHSKLGIFASLAAAVVMSGCSGSADTPDTAEVSGTVTYQGAPLPGALVTFSPVDDEGRPATAITGPQGNYKLSTFGIEDGAVPGSYKVTVSKMSQVAQGDEGSTAEDPGAAYLAMEAQGIDVIGGTGDGIVGGGQQEPQDLIPAKYKNKDTSGLSTDVPDDGTTYDIVLQ